jgi:hypothetical protein
MSQNLVVVNNPPAQAIQTSGFDSKIFAIRPAPLEIVQRMSKSTSEGALVGHFYDTKTGTNLKELVVVLAALPQDNRVLLPPGELGGKPICKSRDGVIPVTDDSRLTPMAPNCANCDHSSWKKWHANGKRREDIPGCRQQVDFVFVERTTLLPFRMNVHGTSLKPFREKMEGIARLAKVLISQGKSPEPYWFSMKLSLVERSNQKGSWSELVINNIAKLEDDAIAAFEKAFKDVMSNRLKIQTEADDETIDGEIVNGASAPAEA